MRKYLIPESGNWYKANMHCHSTVSDGLFSPKEIKDIYKARGYSIVAYTDHNVMVPHTELNDADFLALEGYEIDVNDNKDVPCPSMQKTCHMCLVALKPGIEQVCYHRSKYVWGNALSYADTLRYDLSKPDYERVYTPECISNIMTAGREHGFFVTYNHPAWSLETYRDYSNYHGMHAIELINYGCEMGGFLDYNERIYQELLLDGKKLYCIGSDDNHIDSQHFGGFTMIKADKLDYTTVAEALQNGDFYASEGPEIYGLWIEDGKIHVECQDVQRIIFSTGRRSTGSVYRGNEPLTHASFEISPLDRFVRVSVMDANCKHASTNAYYIEDILE